MALKSLSRGCIITLFMLLPTLLPASVTIPVQQAAAEKESLELIDQVEDTARSVHFNTDALTMHARRHISKWTHNHHLMEIKHLVNDGLNPALDRLIEIKPQLPSWQQNVVDKMLASGRSLATDATSAILSLNEKSPTPTVLNEEYRAFLDSMDEHAENLVRTADAAGDYSAAHRQALEAELEVPKHQ